jgi:hypothetical protein
MTQLEARASMLQAKGVDGVRLLVRDQIVREEPALGLPPTAAGLLVESDAQIVSRLGGTGRSRLLGLGSQRLPVAAPQLALRQHRVGSKAAFKGVCAARTGESSTPAPLPFPPRAQSGRATAFALLDECQRLGTATGRCRVLLHEGVVGLEPGPGPGSAAGAAATAVTETGRRVRARRGVVVAAGVWSGHLLADASGDERWRSLLAPRRGHLLELARPEGMPPVSRGIMELSYTRHYAAAAAEPSPEEAAAAVAQARAGPAEAPGDVGSGGSGDGAGRADITFTATTSSSGTLLIGGAPGRMGWWVGCVLWRDEPRRAAPRRARCPFPFRTAAPGA